MDGPLDVLLVPTLAANPWEAGLSAVWIGASLASLAAVVVMAGRGQLGEAALRRGPERRLELTRADLWIGLGFVGVAGVSRLWVEFSPSSGDEPGPGSQAMAQASSLATIAGLVFFLAKAYLSEAGFRRAGIVPRRPGRDVALSGPAAVIGLLLTLMTLTLVNSVATAMGHPSPPVNHGILQQMQELAWGAELAGLLISAVLVAPVLEEFFFRGLVQTWLLAVWGGAKRWPVVLTAAAVFSVVHLGAVTWHALPGLFVLGIVLGWLYERTGSLLPAVLVHMAFNGFNVAFVLSGAVEG
jgi:membrane protease YdiL (CAAX protease family)